ncbi:MAG: ubiquinone biosynthesis accessory factor UbiJ [Cellvibrionaceae bacterium]
MLDPALHTSFALAIEATIEKALRHDPASLLQLQALHGQVLAIETTTPHLFFYFLPSEKGFDVFTQFEGNITTRLKGSPLSLAQLAKNDRVNLAESGVEVFGSTGFLIELQTILKNLDIDWEEAINDVLGDLAGHQTANAIRKILGWTSGRKKTFTRLLGEYLTEEIKTTPNKTELEKYYHDVSALNLATDRVSARIDAFKIALEKKLQKP